MNRIETVSPELRFLIYKVQNTSELNEFSGGTNLALLFDHRISEDIDLFTNKKLGVKTLKDIKYQLMNSFSKFKPYVRLINDDSNQKVWIRMMVEIILPLDLILFRMFPLCTLQNNLMESKWLMLKT